MFWRFGGYANISTIDTILDKPQFTLEELLDESDLIQELKQHNTKLIECLREREVLEKLLEYVVAPNWSPSRRPRATGTAAAATTTTTTTTTRTARGRRRRPRPRPFLRPPPRLLPRHRQRRRRPGRRREEARTGHAYVAAEVLSSDNWSICEALMESQNRELLRAFWHFLKRPAPLDPLQAGYFTKVNESLFDKKTEEMIDLLKAIDNAVPDMLRHVDSPMIMDLLLKIISLERTDSGQGIVEVSPSSYSSSYPTSCASSYPSSCPSSCPLPALLPTLLPQPSSLRREKPVGVSADKEHC